MDSRAVLALCHEHADAEAGLHIDPRHSFGESVKTVQQLLGHSSPAITLNVHAHLLPDSDDRARSATEAAFADVPSQCPPAVEG
jgi:integrase